MNNLLAQIGNINNPYNVVDPTGNSPFANINTAVGVLFTTLLRAAIVMAGLYALVNFILAGYQFISAGGEPKNITKAWERIWQSVLGLIIVTASIVLAGIVGWIVFGDATFIINPRVYRP